MTNLQIKEKINNYLDKLPTSKLEEIASYIERIYQAEESEHKSTKQPSELGKKLRAIRSEIIAQGEPLLTAEQVEIEKRIRQGEYQEN
ncbi:hypothetical protein GM3708_3554 (plasmid) [Geminocystis sp. NIES-3708]|uniref:hypothetical protein n=1 Tax=Geminocystis sp. NIES-3708 TaxID=1615909 RepID=UPI0005FC6187|nr:hypothetical protein [Geminocystis sp. NIES-3708]BAQ63148.1 hypothetical protein GM3708_3554 [Geminocystis sp. NIES-3708]